MRRGAPGLAGAVLLLSSLAGAGCIGTGVREFTRESYRAPEAAPEAARVFDADAARVWQAWVDELESRQGRFEERDDALRQGVVHLPWGPAVAAASLDLGSVHVVVTETTRTYRSWSPLHFRCNECVVRNGDVIDHQTRVLDERTLHLDPASYTVVAALHARVEESRGGARLAVRLEASVERPEPADLVPASTGRLEATLLDAVAERLESAPAELR